jgi:hypothetical protein
MRIPSFLAALTAVALLAGSPAEAAALSQRLAALPQVARVLSLASLVPGAQDEKLPLIADAASIMAATLAPRPPAAPVTPGELRMAVRTALAELERVQPRVPADHPLRGIATHLRTLAEAPDDTLLATNAALTRFLPAQLDRLRLALQAEPVTPDTIPETLARDWRTPDGRLRVQASAAPAARDPAGLQDFVAAVRGVTPNAGGSAVTIVEMEEARDKVRWGRERRSLAMSDKEKIGTAWHEAGHAYLNMVLPHTHPLHKVTIIPRGPYLGATMYLPDGDKYSTQKKEALANLIVTMGGRIAEAFHSDDVSNGASGDIRQATSLARHMVCEWGMSDQLGMVEYGEGDSPVFLARDMAKSRNYSEETARVIDAEIKHFIDNAYAEATRLLEEGRDKVELIANALLEFETLDASHLRDLIDHGEMKNPPSAPKPPPVPDELRKKPAPKTTTEEQTDDDGPLPGVVGAPA